MRMRKRAFTTLLASLLLSLLASLSGGTGFKVLAQTYGEITGVITILAALPSPARASP